MAIFYLLPLVLPFLYKERNVLKILKKYLLWGVIVALPFILWRVWINQHPEGIPASTWLLNGNGIRFRPAFWRWIFQDRFDREILSVAGFALFFAGLILKPRIRESYLLHLLALSMFAYLCVFATGNVQHDYYQALIIPVVAIFTGRGIVSLTRGDSNFLPRIIVIPAVIFVMGLMYYLTFYEIKGLYQVNNWSIVEAGKEADRILPKNAQVIAPYGGDTAFLYQTNRYGWPLIPTGIDNLVDQYHAQYLVSVAKDEQTSAAMKKYKVIEDTKDFVIVDLTSKK
jgi:hypothetical protein